jgi:nucleotide exchange factor SIL1
MKIGLLLLLILGVSCSIVDTNSELICASDNDCYPKIFVPTREWKSIRPGQDIPSGLHVRLNIDTLQREAKLMDETEEGSSDLISMPIDTTQKLPRQAIPFPSELTFDAAVKQIKYGTPDSSQLAQCLDIVDELSHDIEYGEALTNDKDIFVGLNELAVANADSQTIADSIYRIMASSLRNNQQAVKNFLDVQDILFVSHLFHQLGATTSSDIIQKRILGIIQALLQNDSFRFSYFDINDLYSRYNILGKEAKKRFINILQDSGVGVDVEKRSAEDDPDTEFSAYVQEKLATESIDSPSQFKILFNELTKLHETNRDLQPTKSFLTWLSKEVELRKENSKRDEDQIEFDNEMLRVRHVVFGNPNALRKAMMDEL